MSGRVGSALGGVFDGFGCPATGGLCEDLGTGYLALLVGAPLTIIDGFVNGGYGPDLSRVLEDAGVPIGDVFAGGLINPELFRVLSELLKILPIILPDPAHAAGTRRATL